MRRFLKFLGLLMLLVASVVGLVGVVYYFSERPQKMAIEHPVLDVIDTVREDHTSPPKVVSLLDKVADATQVVKGDIILAPEPEANATAPYGEPADHFGLQILHNRAYSVGYDNNLPAPRWSSYRMFTYQASHHERPAVFKTDTRTKALVVTQEFVRSGYDRGHMTPNYAIAVCYGEEAQHETFLLSNIVPQLHALNAGLWKDIEQRVAHRYVERYGVVWVQVGPVFTDPPAKKVGRLPVPQSFFMIISEYEHPDHGLRAIAYLVPHQEIWHDAELGHYIVSIRQVEKLTGLDFFPKLPKATQDLLESNPAPRAW
jgi:endonuclease G, mitochondrial